MSKEIYDKIGEIDTYGKGLSDWETNFIGNLIDKQPRSFTEKQIAIIERIHSQKVEKRPQFEITQAKRRSEIILDEIEKVIEIPEDKRSQVYASIFQVLSVRDVTEPQLFTSR